MHTFVHLVHLYTFKSVHPPPQAAQWHNKLVVTACKTVCSVTGQRRTTLARHWADRHVLVAGHPLPQDSRFPRRRIISLSVQEEGGQGRCPAIDMLMLICPADERGGRARTWRPRGGARRWRAAARANPRRRGGVPREAGRGRGTAVQSGCAAPCYSHGGETILVFNEQTSHFIASEMTSPRACRISVSSTSGDSGLQSGERSAIL